MSFSKSWNCPSRFVECTLVRINFKLSEEKTVWLLVNNVRMTHEKIAWWKGRKIFLEAIFSHSRKLFSKSTYKFLSLLTWYHRLRKFPIILFQEIIIQNYDVYFSLVLHFFALVLNLNCQPALSYVTPLVSPSWPNSTVCTLFLCPHISALFVNYYFLITIFDTFPGHFR